MRVCSHLLNKFLTKKFIFCALICASKQTENTVKKKTYSIFKKIMLLLHLHFLEKSKFSNFLPLRV